MRNVIVCNIISLDGYFEGPGRNAMVLPMDGFFDEHNLERLRAADTLLLGATTYTGLKGYWPAGGLTRLTGPDTSPSAASSSQAARSRASMYCRGRSGGPGASTSPPRSIRSNQ